MAPAGCQPKIIALSAKFLPQIQENKNNDMKNHISVEESAPIVMRDGAILQADIYRPADNDR